MGRGLRRLNGTREQGAVSGKAGACPAEKKTSPAEETKRALRLKMTEARLRLAPEEAERRGRDAQAALLASSAWAGARTVALYMPIRGETPTDMLFRQALAEGKNVVLPRCLPGGRGLMEFAPCPDPAELVPGVFGILEPPPARAPADFSGGGPELLVAPALACDFQGYRLGYGGGFYDRLLAGLGRQSAPRIGLIYAFQLVPRLPADVWDMRLHGVCTEDGLLLL
jgi:5-formyltetrahydrofolate cyclo-ligase